METSKKNELYASLLGWTPAMFGVSGFDDMLAEAIAAWQQRVGLSVNGVCDQASYSAWLTDKLKTQTAGSRNAQLRAPAAQADSPLKEAGERAVQYAKAIWMEQIIDPPNDSDMYAPSRVRINQFVRGPEGLNWTWQDEYREDGDLAWCGAFVAYAWGRAGLKRELRKTYFSSTHRLNCYGQYKPFNGESVTVPEDPEVRRKWLSLKANSGSADVLEFDPRPGDILLVGGMSSAYGSHVTLIESFDAKDESFITLEGNAHGKWPNGSQVEGVVRCRRPIGLYRSQPDTTYHARRLIRPSILDLE